MLLFWSRAVPLFAANRSAANSFHSGRSGVKRPHRFWKVDQLLDQSRISLFTKQDGKGFNLLLGVHHRCCVVVDDVLRCSGPATFDAIRYILSLHIYQYCCVDLSCRSTSYEGGRPLRFVDERAVVCQLLAVLHLTTSWAVGEHV